RGLAPREGDMNDVLPRSARARPSPATERPRAGSLSIDGALTLPRNARALRRRPRNDRLQARRGAGPRSIGRIEGLLLSFLFWRRRALHGPRAVDVGVRLPRGTF